jgi:hypothetical protein
VGSLTERRAFAVGGYLALMIVPGVAAGVLVDALQTSETVNLVAVSVVPIELIAGLYPGEGSSPPGVWSWAAAYAVTMAVAVAVLAWRYRPGEA